MASNRDVGTLNEGSAERRPISTDVVIPRDVVVERWVVSSGSAVRARDTIAFVRKRSDGNSSAAMATVAAPKHKRPTRRKKSAKMGIDTQGKTENQGNEKSNGSSTSAKISTAVSQKDPLATKKNMKAEPSTEVNRNKDEPAVKLQENDKKPNSAPMLKAKAKENMPIHAPTTGILRIYNTSTQNNDGQPQLRLVIGVIEECLHPTFVDGMCVVCGASRASIKEDENSEGTTNRGNLAKTSQVTVTGGITMTVSQRESENMALLDSRRLFGLKRLSLVLDLDHTLVHATADARARQYLDPAAGDIRIISLPMFEGADVATKKGIDPRHQRMRSRHYIKLRPYVKEFLEGVQEMYEVSVYTAGTRQYAEEIAMVLCRKLAGSNVDSDELEQLRHEAKVAETEYKQKLAETEHKQKLAEINCKWKLETPPNEGSDEKETNEEPPRKKKKVSFQSGITKEKLEAIQAELRTTEALELKAKDLRQKVFGSRIVSRTDVGDLGRDVKSLKRVFPCGGTMAAVVDDREDVWANAKDNSKGTIKGEPPDNLLLVRPYHWQPFVGFADVNNAAGADLSGSGPIKEDRQLLWTKEILEKLHQRYYGQSSEKNRKTVPETLKEMRREVLMGSSIVLSGLVPLHKQSNFGAVARPHFVRYAQNLGAQTQDKVDYNVTYVVAAKDGTDKALSARKIPGCMLVKSAWLMECFWSMSRRDATPFLMHKVTPQLPRSSIPSMQNVLRESKIENSSEGSTNDSDDDDFAAEFENELMDMS
eukprot:CAMPEP_0197176612 /NCGR_PEP_ID=MMETSP1423-20130617/2476_1 /TAXON_ID=476441 /ORGANISM="Pseudo-nitzschia heimii, Strain UNC1101" /LENGTH=763 /DNA_ID=CAMNT_0042626009 /DNA_START=127 /DNA_END=2418 /DNA_ORIENTATION=+